MAHERELKPTPCPHPEWEFAEGLLGASGADGYVRCTLCGVLAVDGGQEFD